MHIGKIIEDLVSSYLFFTMIRNYIITALRNINRNRSISVINVIGLAAGIAGCIIIFLYLQFELSFDKFHSDAYRIYRLQNWQKGNVFMGTDLFALTPAPLAPAIKDRIPEVENICRMIYGGGIVSYKNIRSIERGSMLADSSFLDMFNFCEMTPMIREAFYNPEKVIITQTTAQKYFGSTDPIGKTVKFDFGNKEFEYIIGAVIHDIPDNSHFTFTFLNIFEIASDLWGQETISSWGIHNFYTYLKLNPKTSKETVAGKINELFEENYEYDDVNIFQLEKLTRIHLYSHTNFEMSSNNDIRQIYLFSGVVILILLIACFNYVNLAMARSFQRNKEIGIRKILGADKIMIQKQFLYESLFTTLFALILSVIVVEITLPYFNDLLNSQLSFYNNILSTLILLFGVLVIVGLIAGSYPAFVMSKYQPIEAIRGSKHGVSRSFLRNTLVVFQFIISISLITGVLIVQRQMNFIRNKNLGYTTENIINIPIYDFDLMHDNEALVNDLNKISGVKDITLSGYKPSSIRTQSGLHAYYDTTKTRIMAYINSIDDHFLEFYQIPLLEGRNLNSANGTDIYKACIVNETLMRNQGWEDLDQVRIQLSDTVLSRVVGVVRDFYFASLHERVNPLVLKLQSFSRMISVKIDMANFSGLINKIDRVFQENSPQFPFEYTFLNNSIDESYKQEYRVFKTVKIFTLLSIVIACLGLYGLTTFIAEKKQHEIGIRKVLGASSKQILINIGSNFMFYLMIAMVIAWPVTWYFSSEWLQNFAYRIGFPWDLYILSGLLTMVIACLTIYYQISKAINSNPIDIIKYE